MQGRTILIVDDEERNIKLLKAMLGQDGYFLLEAPDGLQALQIVAVAPPDLLLLDVMMPGIDGFEVCRRIKEDENTKTIPIIMITALQETQDRVMAMEAGADDFLSKPVDQSELKIRVKSLLRIKAYQDELKRSYLELAERSTKLRELEATKEGLIHMVIHDLKGPLTVISGNVQLALLEEDAPESLRRTLERSLLGCHELQRLIQTLLDVYRMEEGKLPLHPAPVDIPELVRETVSECQPRAVIGKKELIVAGEDTLPRAFVDEGIVKRVLSNLVHNAITHTPAGGAIQITGEFLDPENVLCLKVKDSGAGLPPEYHEKVFDKFEQARLRSLGVKTIGSGLGLTFCKMAVEAHGGRIWVESDGDGTGCTFIFTLPLPEQVSKRMGAAGI